MNGYRNIDDSLIAEVYRIIEDAWGELQRSLYVQLRTGHFSTRLPDLSLEEAQRRGAFGEQLLVRLSRLPEQQLPHELAISLRLVRFRASTWANEGKWYWHVIDPLGTGCFGVFLPTAYCGGWFLNTVRSRLATFAFTQLGDADRYLGLIADYARLIDQFTARTSGQAQRGIYMPKVQVLQARGLLSAYRRSAEGAITVASDRYDLPSYEGFAAELKQRVRNQIEPAFDRAIVLLSDEYMRSAPDEVGMHQYSGGSDLYADLVKLHTTMDLTPEEVHARGLQRMERIEQSMRQIEADLGFENDTVRFRESLANDPKWRATDEEAITAVFTRYIERLKPRLGEIFFALPESSYSVAPLSEALRGSMTFGFYDPPIRERKEGIYYFNPKNLTKKPLYDLGTLTYHELMPGHHMHFSSQLEDRSLHPFRMNSFVNSYVEGWAEYAATLAGEIGMYEQPVEQYGRLTMDAFLTSRLVVDTGMNAIGWSLEAAREYMRIHSGMSEAEISTETIRYSCDIPGQALAYKLGDTEILSMRQRMSDGLGKHFNLKEFHASVLKPGALPLTDLAWHIDLETERLKKQFGLTSSN